ncbi:hypothetical protein [Nocardia pseudovaccinii]|uniref:hypothetical protein n=1 Tax=Nocardia pseudovaccinii TaxID=189540 RepID=UPI0012F4F9C1|nr:hypothetical protein [Nocardia pseudovaccinii]
MEAVPDGDGDKGDTTANGGTEGATQAAPNPIPGDIASPSADDNLSIDSDHMLSPIAVVDLVNDNLTAINKRLADSAADALLGMAPFIMYSGIFGDSAIESAWSAFHRAWVREVGVTSSAIAELRKLLPDATAKYEGTDLAGGQAVSGVDIDTPGSGVVPADQPPITSPLPWDPSDSSKR